MSESGRGMQHKRLHCLPVFDALLDTTIQERSFSSNILFVHRQYAVPTVECYYIIANHPVALQLRTLQTMAEIATEKKSTIIFPAQFMTAAKEAPETLKQDGRNV